MIVQFLLMAGCTDTSPVMLGQNQTGVAIAATPATYGITTVSTGKQTPCTEPRPSAAYNLSNTIAASGSGNVNLTDAEKNAVIANLTVGGSSGATISEIDTPESVRFLAQGLFGICQLMSNTGRTISDSELRLLLTVLIENAVKVGAKPN